MSNKEYKWSVERLIDTLNKFKNHKITDMDIYGDYNSSARYIRINLEYTSEAKNTKTEVRVQLYNDNCLDQDKPQQEEGGDE